MIGSFALLITYSRLTTQSGSTATTQVGRAILAHLQNIASKNNSAIALEYANDATLQITATTPDKITTSGTHHGARNISTYWCSYVLCDAASTNFTIDNASYTLKFVGEKAFINATFTMNGDARCVFRSLVHVNLTYVGSGDRWLISQESWNVVDKYGSLCSGAGG